MMSFCANNLFDNIQDVEVQDFVVLLQNTQYDYLDLKEKTDEFAGKAFLEYDTCITKFFETEDYLQLNGGEFPKTKDEFNIFKRLLFIVTDAVYD